MKELNVTVIEQLQLRNQACNEGDRKVEELRKRREVLSCHSGSMPQDTL